MTTLRTIRNLTLTTFLCLLPTLGLLSAEQFAYQDAASKCDREIQTRLAKVSDDYAHELNALMDTFRLRGDLEKTLAVKKESERFASEKTLEEKNLVEMPIQLRELQQQFLAAPRKASEEIAKSYVVKLEDAEKTLTFDSKLDEAISVQQEIDKILKKYGIVNPTKGSEIQTQDLPKYIAMSRDVKIPTIVDGQQVGYTGLSRGEAFRLIKVDGTQVRIRVDKSDVVIPVDDTDLLERIERTQKGLSEEDAAEAEARASASVSRDRLGRVWHTVLGWAWDWNGTWTRRGNSNTFDCQGSSVRGDTWAGVVKITIQGNAVAVDMLSGSPSGVKETYVGKLSADGRSVEGSQFQNGRVSSGWRATIDAPELTTSQQAAKAIVGTWQDGGGWTLVFSGNGTANIAHSSLGLTYNGTWSIDNNSIYVRWDNGCWDTYGPPINSSATPSVNCKGGRNSWSRVR